MTHIVQFPTKKAFKEAVQARDGRVYVDDPSIFNPRSGYACEVAKAGRFTVTNHPKRSWFAAVSLDRNGNIKVD